MKKVDKGISIKFGNKETKDGSGVRIELSGNAIAKAINKWLADQNIYIYGPRTMTVNGDLCDFGHIYVDPPGWIVSNGEKISGEGKISKIKLKGRAWKCVYRVGDEHYEKCHGVDDNEMTLCGKSIIGKYFYDEESNDEITCPECKKIYRNIKKKQ